MHTCIRVYVHACIRTYKQTDKQTEPTDKTAIQPHQTTHSLPTPLTLSPTPSHRTGDCVLVLLEAGADFEAQTDAGERPLHLAVRPTPLPQPPHTPLPEFEIDILEELSCISNVVLSASFSLGHHHFLWDCARRKHKRDSVNGTLLDACSVLNPRTSTPPDLAGGCGDCKGSSGARGKQVGEN
jgi:hypothetical protein